MRILASADDSGSLKEILCSRGTDTSKPDAPQPSAINTYCVENLECRIQQMKVIESGEDQYIITARLGGSVCVYDISSFELVKKFEGLSTIKDDFVSLEYSFGLIYACTESGSVALIHPNAGKFDKDPIELKLTGPVSAFIPHPKQNGIIAYGGKENDIKILSIFEERSEEGFPIIQKSDIKLTTLFQGKNVKNDRLDLRVPIWISRILFIDPSDDKSKPYNFLTVTRYGEIRKYDTGHGRKPVSNFKVSDKPLLTLSTTKNPAHIICSDTQVTTAKYDITKGKLVGKFSGAVGSVQSLHSFLPENHSGIVSSGGLDRYVRLFDIESRALVSKIYVGTKISCVCLLEDDENVEEEKRFENKRSKNRKSKRKDDEKSDDEEDIWNKLEEIEGANKKMEKKKRKL